MKNVLKKWIEILNKLKTSKCIDYYWLLRYMQWGNCFIFIFCYSDNLEKVLLFANFLCLRRETSSMPVVKRHPVYIKILSMFRVPSSFKKSLWMWDSRFNIPLGVIPATTARDVIHSSSTTCSDICPYIKRRFKKERYCVSEFIIS